MRAGVMSQDCMHGARRQRNIRRFKIRAYDCPLDRRFSAPRFDGSVADLRDHISGLRSTDAPDLSSNGAAGISMAQLAAP
jgi:hypothetical protein